MGCSLCVDQGELETRQKRKSCKFKSTMITEERYHIEFPKYEEKKGDYQSNQSPEHHNRRAKDSEGRDSIASAGFPVHNNSTKDQTYRISNHLLKPNRPSLGEHDTECKEFDDWDTISDPKTEVKIKSLTLYANYYICAMEVVYVEADLREFKSVHTSNSLYTLDRADIEKVTLELSDMEYITYISFCYSSQNRYIRSVEVLTSEGQLMVLEGQIELNNMNSDSSSYSSLLTGLGPDKEGASADMMKPDGVGGRSTMLSIKPRVAQSDKVVSFDAKNTFNSKALRKLSVLKPEEKIISLDLSAQNQRVVGFKTQFGKYLKSIELYTEPAL